jgi:putative ABC transport system permease protein
VSLIVEALRSLRAKLALTAAMILIGVTASAVLVTTMGRSAAELAALRRSFDDAGAAVVRVQAEGETSLPLTLCVVLGQVGGVERAVALSASHDVFPVGLVGSSIRAPRRFAATCGEETDTSGLVLLSAPGRSVVGRSAMAALHLAGPVGALTTEAGAVSVIAGSRSFPANLVFLDSAVLTSPERADTQAFSEFVIVLQDARQIEAYRRLAELLLSQAGIDARVSAPIELALLRAGLVEQRLSESRSRLAVGAAGVAVLTAAVAFIGSVLRRREMGRRRVLGASQSWLVALVGAEVILATGLGAIAGALAPLGVLASRDDPVPGAVTVLAAVAFVVLTSAVAALGPAVVSARVDPARALRVP